MSGDHPKGSMTEHDLYAGMTALHRAAAVGNTSVLRTLLAHLPAEAETDDVLNVRVTCNALTPLHLAAAEGHTAMASFLAANGAKVCQFVISHCAKSLWGEAPCGSAVYIARWMKYPLSPSPLNPPPPAQPPSPMWTPLPLDPLPPNPPMEDKEDKEESMT